MNRHALGRSALLTLALGVLVSQSPASAHGFAGKRFFPATVATEDPAVADELSLPTVSRQDGETEVESEWSKRITPTLGISVGDAWTHTPDAEGFQNLETTLKWQFLTNAPHEAIVALGLSAEWGRTGASRVGAERTTTLTPQLYFGKGLGDLPEQAGWLRPLAVTGVIGYTMPVEDHDADDELNPYTMSAGVSVQYSLPYLSANVRDVGLPHWVNQLTPLVEVTFERPVRHGDGATGTVNPGVLWTGRHMQLGAEAIIPFNDDSGDDVGFAVQAHFFLDDLAPRSLGRPILGARR